jgi:hypothetical protein
MQANPLAPLAFIAGLLVVGGTTMSVMRTLVVPRSLPSRLSRVVTGSLWVLLRFMANRLSRYESKDRLLAYAAPLSLLALLTAWVGCLWVGYALLLLPFQPSVYEAVVHAGSAMFTLGFATVQNGPTAFISFAAAATGLVVVALQISYLPTLYAAYNRRETLVTMLDTRAGAPPWGPEILARAQLVGLIDELPGFYAEWERWAADVAESHTNYPVLLWFRSPHPLRSWLLALLSVLDSAALFNALSPERSPMSVRLCLRMGFTCLRDIARVLRIDFDPDPQPDAPITLTFEEFAEGVHSVEHAGFVSERTLEEAWLHFRGWRVNYERVAYVLADMLVAPPGTWSGQRRDLPGVRFDPRRPVDRRPHAHPALGLDEAHSIGGHRPPEEA